jgi:hypothetical protein
MAVASFRVLVKQYEGLAILHAIMLRATGTFDLFPEDKRQRPARVCPVEAIEQAVQSLVAAKPTNARLAQLLGDMGFNCYERTKDKIVQEIRQKILNSKGAFERPNA